MKWRFLFVSKSVETKNGYVDDDDREHSEEEEISECNYSSQFGRAGMENFKTPHPRIDYTVEQFGELLG